MVTALIACVVTPDAARAAPKPTASAAKRATAQHSGRRRKAPAPPMVRHRPNDGTLPHPRRSLCEAGDPKCQAIIVRSSAETAAYTRHQPRFRGTISKLPQAMRRAMTGVSWRPGCPLSLDALRLVTVDHWRPDGSITRGQIIVAATVAPLVRSAFAHYFHTRFPITTMAPVYRFGGSDDRSMKADNTSAFNCRKMTGGSRWSEHAYGTAIDINPLRNPYVKGKLVLPPSARGWAKRATVRPGMLVPNGPGVAVWRRAGWGWGGAWRTLQDYQHVSKSGR